MDRKLGGLILAGLMLAPLQSLAQTTPYEGGRAIGEALFGSPDDEVYRRRLLQNYEIQAAQRQALDRQANMEAGRAFLALLDALARDWQELGLSPEDARSVADTYRITAEQPAIDLRVRNAGMAKSVDDAVAAYKRYDYLLANQLLAGIRAQL